MNLELHLRRTSRQAQSFRLKVVTANNIMKEKIPLTLTTLVSLSKRLLRMLLHLNLFTFDCRNCTTLSETVEHKEG